MQKIQGVQKIKKTCFTEVWKQKLQNVWHIFVKHSKRISVHAFTVASTKWVRDKKWMRAEKWVRAKKWARAKKWPRAKKWVRAKQWVRGKKWVSPKKWWNEFFIKILIRRLQDGIQRDRLLKRVH